MGPSEWWSPRCGGGLQWLKNCGSTGHPGAEEFVLMISVVITPLSRSTWDGEAANLGLKPLGEEGEWQNWKMQSAVTRWWETQRNRRLKKKKREKWLGKLLCVAVGVSFLTLTLRKWGVGKEWPPGVMECGFIDQAWFWTGCDFSM